MGGGEGRRARGCASAPRARGAGPTACPGKPMRRLPGLRRESREGNAAPDPPRPCPGRALSAACGAGCRGWEERAAEPRVRGGAPQSEAGSRRSYFQRPVFLTWNLRRMESTDFKDVMHGVLTGGGSPVTPAAVPVPAALCGRPVVHRAALGPHALAVLSGDLGKGVFRVMKTSLCQCLPYVGSCCIFSGKSRPSSSWPQIFSFAHLWNFYGLRW